MIIGPKTYPRGSMLCLQCHQVGQPKTKVKGSFLVELALWICFLIPGLIYSLWRSSSAGREKVCPHCGSNQLIPPSSPAAKKILEA